MQRAKSMLAVLMAIPLAGCLLRGKPAAKTPTSPSNPVVTQASTAPANPPALSIPQTRAELPSPQPLPEEALATTPPEEEPPPRPVPVVKTPPKRQTTQAAAPKPETPPVPPPAESERLPVQEIVPAEQQNRLREEANASRRECQQIVKRVQDRRPTRAQRGLIDRIQALVKQSESKERSGDLPAAKQLADIALGLAKDMR